MADRKFDSNQQRPQPIFTRSADGRLRPANVKADIGDVWAEQRRMQLAEAIEQDKLKAAKKQQKGRFFSRRKIAGATPPAKPKAANQPKEIALTISLPRLPKPPNLFVIYKKLPKIGKKQLLIGGGALLLAAAGFGIYELVGNSKHTTATPKSQNSADVLSANSQTPQSPDYDTILPKGKGVNELGGWGRVSPPGKDPVFAYVDKVGNVRLTVSEQPLPDAFKEDIKGEVAKLAKQFSANDKLAVAADVPAYVGTSHNGPQSAIVAKHNLLILIKSDSALSTVQWVEYIDSLQ